MHVNSLVVVLCTSRASLLGWEFASSNVGLNWLCFKTATGMVSFNLVYVDITD